MPETELIRIGLAQPNPQRVLLVSGHTWARKIAKLLQEHGIKVLLVDAYKQSVHRVDEEGLPATRTDILSERVMDEEVFETSDVYQLTSRSEVQRDREGELPQHLQGLPLFDREVTYTTIQERFDRGATIEAIPLTESFTFGDFGTRYGEHAIPLFLIPAPGQPVVFSSEARPSGRRWRTPWC